MPKSQRLSDATLVRRSQQGDRRSFGALLARYDRRLRGLAHALLLDREQMDAALGLAYLRAWRDVVRIRPRDDVGPWLYRAAYNACIDELRRSGPPGGGPVAPDQPPGGGDLRAALSCLPPVDRVAVVLVEREGFTVASAARILGVTASDLEARLDAARGRLAPHVPVGEPGGSAPTAEGTGGDDLGRRTGSPAVGGPAAEPGPATPAETAAGAPEVATVVATAADVVPEPVAAADAGSAPGPSGGAGSSGDDGAPGPSTAAHAPAPDGGGGDGAEPTPGSGRPENGEVAGSGPGDAVDEADRPTVEPATTAPGPGDRRSGNG
jgi:RNA polymerase sigma-70 factor (ECF subfamily)